MLIKVSPQVFMLALMFVANLPRLPIGKMSTKFWGGGGYPPIYATVAHTMYIPYFGRFYAGSCSVLNNFLKFHGHRWALC